MSTDPVVPLSAREVAARMCALAERIKSERDSGTVLELSRELRRLAERLKPSLEAATSAARREGWEAHEQAMIEAVAKRKERARSELDLVCAHEVSRVIRDVRAAQAEPPRRAGEGEG